MTLDVSVRTGPGGFVLDVDLRAADDETVVLLGPNGAGKSTLLRAVAGLDPVVDGSVAIDGEVVDDAAAGVFVPPERRRVGLVPQSGALFGHLSALDNVAFGLRAGGVGRDEARRRAAAWLERVELAGLGDRRPRELSGGEAQRVALARALITEPRALLLDEPLSALDAGTRSRVRGDLRRHLDGFGGVRLVVTHDPADAFALADRVVVLDGGRVVQEGAMAEVVARPRSGYVADLAGLNLVAARSVGGLLRSHPGDVDLGVAAGDGAWFVAFPPDAVTVVGAGPGTAAGPDTAGIDAAGIDATVDDVEVASGRLRLRLGGAVPVLADLPAGGERLGVGGRCRWAIDVGRAVVYPADGRD